MSSIQPTIGVVIITHSAKHHLQNCLPPILNSSLKPRVLLVNSSSNDGTVELAAEMGAETLIIPRKEFNHGLTRERARKILDTDIVVMMTPDAYALDESLIEKLIEPLISIDCAVTYARQVPHNGADFFERFPRDFNYPALTTLQTRSIEDKVIFGAKTFFCSNSCAAYNNRLLDEVGGFPETLTAEDYIATIKLLSAGYKIGYVSSAVVKHSHRYTLLAEFKRMFDTGYIRAIFTDIEHLTGPTEKTGNSYFKAFIQASWKENVFYIPYLFVICTVKYIGFKIGYFGKNLPLWMKKSFSGSDFYWTSVYYKCNQ